MSEPIDKVNNLSKQMDSLVNDTQTHQNLMKSLTDIMISDINNNKEDVSALNDEMNKLDNETRLLNSQIEEKNAKIKEFKLAIDEITPKLGEQENLVNEINANIADLKKRLGELNESVNVKTAKEDNLNKELEEKTNAKNDLMKSIDEKVQVNTDKLESAKSELTKMKLDYGVWDFIYGKIEAPEIEILSIIAANRGISVDAIKGKAKSVQAVFVGRAISKLEADGKIVMKDDETWDLSPQLLESI